MRATARSVLLAGATLLTASTVAVAQSVDPAPPPSPAASVALTAAVRPLPDLRSITALPEAPTVLAVPIAPNLANAIDNVYVDVEQWVQYGFEVAAAAVSWIPYVGWFSGQIMVVYDFGESIVASGVFNFTDWLRGDGGIIANVVDFGIDVALAFVWLGLDEVAQFIPLPPCNCYPPRPPVGQPVLAAETLAAPPEEVALTVEAPAEETTESVEPAVDEATADEDLAEEEVTEAEVIDEEVTDQAVAEEEVTEDEVTDEEVETTDTSGTIQAQGEVRGGSEPVTDTVTDEGDTSEVRSSGTEAEPPAPAPAPSADNTDDTDATDSGDAGSGSGVGASPE